jgi:hypothetical protein
MPLFQNTIFNAEYKKYFCLINRYKMINYLLLAIIILVFLASVYIVRLTKSVKIMKQIKEKEIKEKKRRLTLTVMKSRLICSKTNS